LCARSPRKMCLGGPTAGVHRDFPFPLRTSSPIEVIGQRGRWRFVFCSCPDYTSRGQNSRLEFRLYVASPTGIGYFGVNRFFQRGPPCPKPDLGPSDSRFPPRCSTTWRRSYPSRTSSRGPVFFPSALPENRCLAPPFFTPNVSVARFCSFCGLLRSLPPRPPHFTVTPNQWHFKRGSPL